MSRPGRPQNPTGTPLGSGDLRPTWQPQYGGSGSLGLGPAAAGGGKSQQRGTYRPPPQQRPGGGSAQPRPLSAQSNKSGASANGSQTKPELRNKSKEEIQKEIKLLEEILAASGMSGITGSATARTASPVPPESTDGEVRKRGDGDRNEQVEAQLRMKERQVVELRAQIARFEKQHLSSNASSEARGVYGGELEHRDPERTGPPGHGNLPGFSAPIGTSSSLGFGGTAGSTSCASTPGGRNDLVGQLEAELQRVVKQIEGHRKQIQQHQHELTLLEKRHAEIVAALSVHIAGAAGGRSPASTLAERLEQVADEAGVEHFVAQLGGISKELLDSSGAYASEPGATADDPLIGSLPSSLTSSAARAAERAARNGGYSGRRGVAAMGRPTSAGSNGSRDLGSAVSRASASGSQAASNAAYSAAARSRTAGAVPSVTRASSTAAGDGGGSSRGGAGGEPLSFGKSYEAERIVYMLNQFSMCRPLRIPFVPLDGPAEGEGKPYLYGALEVCIVLSEDGNKLLVKVNSGGSTRNFDIEEFVQRAEAFHARPKPIAEETEPPPAVEPSLFGLAPEPASAAPPGFLGPSADPASSPPLRALLGRPLGKEMVGGDVSSLPWKKLFKSHWNN